VFDGDYLGSLPVPRDIVVVGDDNSARLRWGNSLQRESAAVEGYRVCFGKSQNNLQYGALFTQRIGTLFNLKNNETLVGVIQSVNKYGEVSAPSNVFEIRANPTRVNQLAASMTGFFDDFNKPAGALDEKKWNVAFSACVDPAASYTYIGNSYHAVSVLGNASYLPGAEHGCDRGQNIARPRAIFDFTQRTGKIVFDFDGSQGNRSTWYVDVFPYESDADIIDITGHVTFDPGHGHPGRFLRFSQADNVLMIHQLATDGNPIAVAKYDFQWDFPDEVFLPGQVMRHMVLEVSKSRAAIYIDGKLILENKNINLDFEKATVHWSQFGYNPTKVGYPWHAFRWDNFGFDGPSRPLVVNNYKTSFNRTDILAAETGKVWRVNIPDSLESAISARYFYTIQMRTQWYQWRASDKFIINGQTFALPEPTSTAGTWQDGILGQIYPPYSGSIEIPLDLLNQGINEFRFDTYNTTVLNQHVEIRFANEQSRASYTPPTQIITASPVPALTKLGPSVQLVSLNRQAAPIRANDPPRNGYELELTQTLSGTVEFGVYADNIRPLAMGGPNLGVAYIDMLVDGEVVGRVNTSTSSPAPATADGAATWPYTCCGVPITLDTTSLSNGDHELVFVAYDSEGNKGRPGYWMPGSDGSSDNETGAIRFRVEN